MFARGQLRHYAAVFAVDIDLRSHDAGQDFAPIGNHRRGGFVAGRFNAQDAHAHGFILRHSRTKLQTRRR